MPKSAVPVKGANLKIAYAILSADMAVPNLLRSAPQPISSPRIFHSLSMSRGRNMVQYSCYSTMYCSCDGNMRIDGIIAAVGGGVYRTNGK